MNVPDCQFSIIILGNVDGDPNKGEVYAIVEGEELSHHEFDWRRQGPGSFQFAHASAEAAAIRAVTNPQTIRFDDYVVDVDGKRATIWDVYPGVPGSKDVWDKLSPEARKKLVGAGS